MRKIFATTGLVLLVLAGCGTKPAPIIDQTQFIVVAPPETFLKCPQILQDQIPDPATLTNQEIADFIEMVIRYNGVCGINMKKIREFVATTRELYFNQPERKEVNVGLARIERWLDSAPGS